VVQVVPDLYPGGVYDLAGTGEAQLDFKPTAVGKSYLIDCKVHPCSRYRVIADPGAAVQIFQNTNHLPVVYTAASADLVRVIVKRDPAAGWVFYSCEVTMLD
jgi:hypothetical protein